MDKAEKYFEQQKRLIKKAKTTNELLDIMSKDIPGDYFRQNLKKELNKKFKGDFKKSQQHCLKQINADEHNYFTRDEGIKMKRTELRQIILQELKGNWFKALSPEKQKEYLKDHPDSKMAKGVNGTKDDKEQPEEAKKIYHFRNSITGARIDIKLTAKEAEKKKEDLGNKWKLLSTEEYLRECIQDLIKEVLTEDKHKAYKVFSDHLKYLRSKVYPKMDDDTTYEFNRLLKHWLKDV